MVVIALAYGFRQHEDVAAEDFFYLLRFGDSTAAGWVVQLGTGREHEKKREKQM